ncbi:MAG: hypothetical protein QNJ60_06045 [Xenococcaceae cyanobacterium MO_188.B19]|nr:hypothetical protein [Xenococcaceae cyanobacterium MO_188.B19]
MTYLQEIQTIEANGIPYVEYRPQREIEEDVIITIEFTPKQQTPGSEYHYSQPEFRFNDLVATRQDWEHCYKHRLPETELDTFRISAMELVDNLTPSGQLLSQPRWKYGLRSSHSKNLVWFEEQALVRVTESNPDWF